MSHDRVRSVLVVLENSSRKLNAQKFSKSKKIYEMENFGYNDVIELSNDVIVSRTKFLKTFGDNLPSCKKSWF